MTGDRASWYRDRMPSLPTCTTGTISYNVYWDAHIKPPYSHIAMLGFMGVIVACLIRSWMHRSTSERLAEEADNAFDATAPLAEGARFISGRVEYAAGQTNAISVHVRQSGKEVVTKHGPHQEWDEVGRSTLAQPFYVRRTNGDRIRVEPGTDPFLVDSPDEFIWKDRDRRIRVATLSPNEWVIVQGILKKGPDPEAKLGGHYRDAAYGWVMTPIGSQRMEVSAEKLGDRHRKRAAAFRVAMGRILGALLVASAFFAPYGARLALGERKCGEVVRKERTPRAYKTPSEYYLYVRVDVPEKPEIPVVINWSNWGNIGVGSIVGFRYVPQFPSWSTPGTGASTHILPLIFAGQAAIFACAFYFSTRNRRRWYERKLKDVYVGRLPDRPPEG